MAEAFDRRILGITAHRPWPLPAAPWVMRQSWHNLLFAHWPLDPAAIAPCLPRPLRPDVYDGQAWVGIVPFMMTGVGLRGLPPVPGLSRFPELNVRTYVTVGGRPGVYFFSLDAASTLAVLGARICLGLPYYRASMRIAIRRGEVLFDSRRRGARGQFDAAYAPSGSRFEAPEGSLEYFLTERYCLYTVRRGRIRRLDIHHPPWGLQPARAVFAVNTMGQSAGLPLPRTEPLLHFAARQDMVGWLPETVL